MLVHSSICVFVGLCTYSCAYFNKLCTEKDQAIMEEKKDHSQGWRGGESALRYVQYVCGNVSVRMLMLSALMYPVIPRLYCWNKTLYVLYITVSTHEGKAYWTAHPPCMLYFDVHMHKGRMNSVLCVISVTLMCVQLY